MINEGEYNVFYPLPSDTIRALSHHSLYILQNIIVKIFLYAKLLAPDP